MPEFLTLTHCNDSHTSIDGSSQKYPRKFYIWQTRGELRDDHFVEFPFFHAFILFSPWIYRCSLLQIIVSSFRLVNYIRKMVKVEKTHIEMHRSRRSWSLRHAPWWKIVQDEVKWCIISILNFNYCTIECDLLRDSKKETGKFSQNFDSISLSLLFHFSCDTSSPLARCD